MKVIWSFHYLAILPTHMLFSSVIYLWNVKRQEEISKELLTIFFQDGSYQLNIIPFFLCPAHFSSVTLSFIHSWLISSCISFLYNNSSETCWRLSAALLWDLSHRYGKDAGRCCTNRQSKVCNHLKELHFEIKCCGSAYLNLFLVTLGRDFMVFF